MDKTKWFDKKMKLMQKLGISEDTCQQQLNSLVRHRLEECVSLVELHVSTYHQLRASILDTSKDKTRKSLVGKMSKTKEAIKLVLQRMFTLRVAHSPSDGMAVPTVPSIEDLLSDEVDIVTLFPWRGEGKNT